MKSSARRQRELESSKIRIAIASQNEVAGDKNVHCAKYASRLHPQAGPPIEKGVHTCLFRLFFSDLYPHGIGS
jgi:hypothetical protein